MQNTASCEDGIAFQQKLPLSSLVKVETRTFEYRKCLPSWVFPLVGSA